MKPRVKGNLYWETFHNFFKETCLPVLTSHLKGPNSLKDPTNFLYKLHKDSSSCF